MTGLWRRSWRPYLPILEFLGRERLNHLDAWLSEKDAEDSATGNQEGLGAQGGLAEEETMSDVDRAIRVRAAKSPGFQTLVDKGLAELRIGLTIKELRQKNGMTQEDLARRLKPRNRRCLA